MISIIEELAIDEWQNPDEYFPSYNVAPSQTTPVLVYNDKRIVTPMRWGLIPYWSKKPARGAGIINARAESIMKRPSFKNLMHRNRCVVIADGYYEWKKAGDKRQPYYIHHPDKQLLPMAGLWDSWRDPDGKAVLSYTVITTTPRPELAHIHNRMPVILNHNDISRWIEWKQHTATLVIPLLKPCDFTLAVYPVSPMINAPGNDHSDCILPLTA